MYDIAIIGGGVVGCAILHECTKEGYSCILLEKEKNLVSGASSGNSAQMITDTDCEPHSLEAECLRLSSQIAPGIFEKYNIPIEKKGFLIVAWNKGEYDRLPGIVKKARAAGDTEVRKLSKEEIEQLEPNLSKTSLGGVLVPSEAVVDSWFLPVALAHQSRRWGAQVSCNSEVVAGTHDPRGGWELTTPNGVVKAKVVINAAGLYGDKVENINKPSLFSIKPRKGQYLVYGKDAGHLIKHMITPVPDDRTEKQGTKGVIVFPSVYGNLLVGPTAEDVPERSSPKTVELVLNSLMKHGHSVLPSLVEYKPIGSYAGLRPATEHKDYQIKADKSRQWITVGGIRSTGVSACLGIARLVRRLLEEELGCEAARAPPAAHTSALPWFSDKPSVVLDGAEYSVTHPLSKYGLTKAKL